MNNLVQPDPSSTSPPITELEYRSAAAAAKLVCLQEQIHLPGTIQPHGALLAIDPPQGWTVVAVSDNAAELLYLLPAEVFLGRSMASILGAPFAEAAQRRFRDGRLVGRSPWQSTFEVAGAASPSNVTVHSHAGLVLVELEQASAQDGTDAQATLRRLQHIMVDLRQTGSELVELAHVAAKGVRRLTGYERVLVYRFDADWNGQAIAEDKVAEWDNSLNGLRFPAADIPAQARALYERSPMRWVADRDATPMPLSIDPSRTDERGQSKAIDLSFARLRSPSPVHLQIHRNLGINGFMSLSILYKERLWGLMVCHHRQPHYLSSSQRSAAATLTDAFALCVGPAERSNSEQTRRDSLVRLSSLLGNMAEADVVSEALTAGNVTIGSLFSATGAAVIYDGAISLVGHTPPKADVGALADWLRTQRGAGKPFQTNNLIASYPAWEQHAALASGVLAVFLSSDQSDMLLWFRAEEPDPVSWGSGSHMRRPENQSQPAAAPIRAMGRRAARLCKALGRVGGGDGRDPPARHHRSHGPKPAPDCGFAGKVAPKPENGGSRPVDRRDCARLQ